MKLIDSAHLRRLLPATLLAAAATLGGSAVGDPAVACAAPTDEEVRDQFEHCARWADNAYLDGNLTEEQWEADLESCCLNAGGMWTPTVFPRCSAAAMTSVPRPAVTPPTDAATLPTVTRSTSAFGAAAVRKRHRGTPTRGAADDVDVRAATPALGGATR